MTLRYIYTLLYSLILIFTLPSCSKDDEPQVQPPHQTLLFYFVGTDLNTHLRNNRKAIKAALNYNIQGNSRVVIFHQDGAKKKGDIIELKYQDGLCQEEVLTTITLPSEMNADALGDIFSQMIDYAPANSYSLIIGSHGLGWIPLGAEPEGSISALGGKRTLTHNDLWYRDNNPITRYIGDGVDYNPENSFDVTTLSQALTSTGVKMEYILFDACFMSNVESLYDLRHNTKYIIGSTCEIMGAGFPYRNILPLMLKDNGTSYDLDGICEAFYLDYKDDAFYPSGAVALIDCSQLEALAKSMKAVNTAAQKDYNPDDIQSYERLDDHVFFDLGDYVDAMCDDESIKEAFNRQLELCVITKYAPKKFYSAYPRTNAGQCDLNVFSGLSTSAPSIFYRDVYVQTSWYKATH